MPDQTPSSAPMSSSTAARQDNGKFGAQHGDVVNAPLDDQPTMAVCPDGTREWRLNGRHHRLGGPAIKRANGTRVWLVDGMLHRVDGPAIKSADGGRMWFLNDRRHRLDGPAVDYADGYQEFWINGKRYATEADWRQAVEARTHTG